MKQINSFKCVCFIAAFLLVMASCKKGDTGAAGPVGPAGPQGTQGVKGDTGVANVIYSPWISVAFTQASTTAPFIGTIAAPKLDLNMLTKGEMKVYFNGDYPATPSILPLPFTNGNVVINVQFDPGQITIISNVDISSGTDAGGTYQQFRYILIPGGKAARSAIDWNNYAEVKKYLNLKD